MDTRTGNIIRPEDVEKFRALLGDNLKQMELAPTEKQMFRKPPRVGRNDPCPCGSGKKFKRCCYTGGRR